MTEYRDHITAYHEAGHIVMARHEGFQVYGIRLLINGKGEAEYSLSLPCRSEGAEQYIRKRIRVLLAGAVAQCMIAHPGDTQCFKDAVTGNAAADWRIALELGWALNNISSDTIVEEEIAAREVDALLSGLVNETQAILREPSNHDRLMAVGRTCLSRLVELRAYSPDDLMAPNDAVVTQQELNDMLA